MFHHSNSNPKTVSIACLTLKVHQAGSIRRDAECEEKPLQTHQDGYHHKDGQRRVGTDVETPPLNCCPM